MAQLFIDFSQFPDQRIEAFGNLPLRIFQRKSQNMGAETVPGLACWHPSGMPGMVRQGDSKICRTCRTYATVHPGEIPDCCQLPEQVNAFRLELLEFGGSHGCLPAVFCSSNIQLNKTTEK